MGLKEHFAKKASISVGLLAALLGSGVGAVGAARGLGKLSKAESAMMQAARGKNMAGLIDDAKWAGAAGGALGAAASTPIIESALSHGVDASSLAQALGVGTVGSLLGAKAVAGKYTKAGLEDTLLTAARLNGARIPKV